MRGKSSMLGGYTLGGWSSGSMRNLVPHLNPISTIRARPIIFCPCAEERAFLRRKPVRGGRCSSAVMHSLIRLVHSLLLALLVLHSHPRLGGHAKTIAPSTAKPAPKTDLSKITPRNSAANQIFAVRPDAEGKTTLTCQCVVYHHCDVQDVYYPTTSER